MVKVERKKGKATGYLSINAKNAVGNPILSQPVGQ